MCGIAGIVNLRPGPPPDPALLRRMACSVRHRGPDEFGIYRDAEVGLAHARLSVIDLALGRQPLSNEDGTLWISFNGEVYNYLEMRPELEARGHRFTTATDTEVLLHAFEEWGDDAIGRFNGQFALALWDRRRRRLLLARDRLGVRPLYTAERAGRLCFASEVKSLFADPEFPRRIDPEGLDEVFTFWANVAPTTPFAGVRELAPGHVLVHDVGAGRSRVSAYWEPRYPPARAPARLSLDEAAEALRGALDRATRLRLMRSDVPVGSYLSGGLDSSLVAALARGANGGRFETFSVRFADAEFDETRWQLAMARQLGSEHHEIRVTANDIAGVFPDVVFHAERPVLRTAPAPLYLLSRLTHDCGFKVVLTGEGADEMLAGYDLFREAKVRAFWARQPGSRLRPLLLERLYPYLARSPAAAKGMARSFFAHGLDRAGEPGFSHAPRWRATSSLKRLFSAVMRDALRGADAERRLLSSLPKEFGGWDALSQAQYLELRTLLSGYILSSQGDRMLMAHSVEGRFPFLDRDVVELCNALPPPYKLRVLDEKHVLKRAARGLVPDEIIARPKQPYRAPDAACFAGDDAPEYVEDLLGERALRESGLFDPAAVRLLLSKCRARTRLGPLSNADNMALVGVLSTQILWDRLVRSPPPVRETPIEEIEARLVDAAAGSAATRAPQPGLH